jgi:hypothetical protein
LLLAYAGDPGGHHDRLCRFVIKHLAHVADNLRRLAGEFVDGLRRCCCALEVSSTDKEKMTSLREHIVLT